MKLSCRKDHSLNLFLLFSLCLILYYQTVNFGWHLDDPPNILLNSPLHINDLHPETLCKTFFAHPTNPGTLFRPVSNLSFSLNWFFGQNNPVGYHIVNTGIHLLTAVMLYLSCLLLLQSPALKKLNLKHQASISILAACLWLIAPINSQTVVYIVQRMAQLAAFFSITTIFFFLLFRFASGQVKKTIYLILCFFCALLAIGSKENSITLPLSILLIEVIFFHHRHPLLQTIQKNKKASVLLLIAGLAATVYLLLHYGKGAFNYEHRSFTMLERILTEPRILIFYLSQIFLPTTADLSIEHDVIVSTSLFRPWTTLPAIISCTGLIIISFLRMHKNPLISFAILFFFINHLVESTFIHLELIFEHRNYLPSLFLFLPVAAFIAGNIWMPGKVYRKTTRPLLLIICTGFLVLSCISTYNRNKTWASDFLLWQDAVTKAPENGRAKLNLASHYLAQKQYDKAIALCNQAEQLQGASRNKLVPISLGIKGDIAYAKGDIDKSLRYFQEALSLREDYIDVAYKIIAVLIKQEQYEEALVTISAVSRNKVEPNLLLIKASILLRLNRPDESIKTYKAARRFFKTSTLITEGLGKALQIQGHYQQAEILLKWAVKNNERYARLLLIENTFKAGRTKQAAEKMKQLLHNIPFNRLNNEISGQQDDAYIVPFDNALLNKLLIEATREMTNASLDHK